MSPAPNGAQLNKPGIDREHSAQPHTDREGSLVWSLTPQWEEITSNGAWPCFHLPSTAWRWGMRRLRLWGSKLGEPCPVQCQCVQQPTPHRLVVQDRKALECPEFGQCRWPVGLCLLQECDSPSQPGPHGQTVCLFTQGLFVHEPRWHGCGELPVVPCVLCIHWVATKACGSMVLQWGMGIAFSWHQVLVSFWRRALPLGVSQPSDHPPSTPRHVAGSWSRARATCAQK